MNEGITIVLDFTTEAPEAEREVLSHSARSVKGGRHTGKRDGTVAAFTRRVIDCPLCGGKRMDFDGPHSPISIGVDTIRDCAGRIFVKGVLQ